MISLNWGILWAYAMKSAFVSGVHITSLTIIYFLLYSILSDTVSEIYLLITIDCNLSVSSGSATSNFKNLQPVSVFSAIAPW